MFESFNVPGLYIAVQVSEQSGLVLAYVFMTGVYEMSIFGVAWGRGREGRGGGGGGGTLVLLLLVHVHVVFIYVCTMSPR